MEVRGAGAPQRPAAANANDSKSGGGGGCCGGGGGGGDTRDTTLGTHDT